LSARACSIAVLRASIVSNARDSRELVTNRFDMTKPGPFGKHGCATHCVDSMNAGNAEKHSAMNRLQRAPYIQGTCSEALFSSDNQLYKNLVVLLEMIFHAQYWNWLSGRHRSKRSACKIR
jgi:hypothetical protein